MSDPNCLCTKLLNPLLPNDDINEITHVCKETERASCRNWVLRQLIHEGGVSDDTVKRILRPAKRVVISRSSEKRSANPNPPILVRLPDGRTGELMLGTITISQSSPIPSSPPLPPNAPLPFDLPKIPYTRPNPLMSQEIILIVQQWIGDEIPKFGDLLRSVAQSDVIAQRVQEQPLFPSIANMIGGVDPGRNEERKHENLRSAMVDAINKGGLPTTPGVAEYLAGEESQGVLRAGLLTTFVCVIKDDAGNRRNSTLIQDFCLPFVGGINSLFRIAGKIAQHHIDWWTAIAIAEGIPILDMDLRKFNFAEIDRSVSNDPRTPEAEYKSLIEEEATRLSKQVRSGELTIQAARDLVYKFAIKKKSEFNQELDWDLERRRIYQLLKRKCSRK